MKIIELIEEAINIVNILIKMHKVGNEFNEHLIDALHYANLHLDHLVEERLKEIIDEENSRKKWVFIIFD